MNITLPAIAAIGLLAATHILPAASTDPVGAMKMTLSGQFDTRISIPMMRMPVFEGLIDSVSEDNLIIAGEPGWESNQFVFENADNPDPLNTYFVFILTGELEGFQGKILSNTSDTLTIDTGLDSLATVAEGDIIQIVPYWTLESLFDGVDLPDGTNVFTYSRMSGKLNTATDIIYTYFKDNDAWWDGISPNFVDDTALLNSGLAYIVRLPEGSSNVEFVVSGSVPMASDRKLFYVLGKENEIFDPTDIKATDQPFSIKVPVPIAIGDAALNLSDQTQVFVYLDGDYEPAQGESLPKINNPPRTILTYFETQNEWWDGVSPDFVSNTYFLQPGKSYVLRVPEQNTTEVVESIVNPPYPTRN